LKLERRLVKLAADDHLLIQTLHLGIGERIGCEARIEMAIGIEDAELLNFAAIDNLGGHSVSSATAFLWHGLPARVFFDSKSRAGSPCHKELTPSRGSCDRIIPSPAEAHDH